MVNQSSSCRMSSRTITTKKETTLPFPKNGQSHTRQFIFKWCNTIAYVRFHVEVNKMAPKFFFECNAQWCPLVRSPTPRFPSRGPERRSNYHVYNHLPFPHPPAHLDFFQNLFRGIYDYYFYFAQHNFVLLTAHHLFFRAGQHPPVQLLLPPWKRILRNLPPFRTCSCRAKT